MSTNDDVIRREIVPEGDDGGFDPDERERVNQWLKQNGCRAKTMAVRERREQQDGWAAWNAWADARIAAAIKAEHEYMMGILAEAVGQVIASERNDVRAALDKVRVELAEKVATLRGELTGRLAAIDPATARAAKGDGFRFAREKSAADAEAAELPRFLASRAIN